MSDSARFIRPCLASLSILALAFAISCKPQVQKGGREDAGVESANPAEFFGNLGRFLTHKSQAPKLEGIEALSLQHLMDGLKGESAKLQRQQLDELAATVQSVHADGKVVDRSMIKVSESAEHGVQDQISRLNNLVKQHQAEMNSEIVQFKKEEAEYLAKYGSKNKVEIQDGTDKAYKQIATKIQKYSLSSALDSIPSGENAVIVVSQVEPSTGKLKETYHFLGTRTNNQVEQNGFKYNKQSAFGWNVHTGAKEDISMGTSGSDGTVGPALNRLLDSRSAKEIAAAKVDQNATHGAADELYYRALLLPKK